MLCDDLVANGAPGSCMEVGAVIKRVGKAQKFMLSPDFAAVADALSSDYTGLVRVFPFCRLPYPETWIEVAHQDRPQFRESPIYAPAFQAAPRRVGYLLTATRPDLSAWKTHLLWSMPDGQCSAATMAVQFDMTALLSATAKVPTTEEERAAAPLQSRTGVIERDFTAHPGWAHASDSVKLAMMQHTSIEMADYDMPLPVGVPRSKWPEFFDAMADLARADWAGEPGFILAVIGLMNARNAVELEPAELGRLNKARAKRGHPPLYEHKLLKIADRRMLRSYPDKQPHGDQYRSLRHHFVRGHFKKRESGVFFWTPHARGDLRRGRIEKEYEL